MGTNKENKSFRNNQRTTVDQYLKSKGKPIGNNIEEVARSKYAIYHECKNIRPSGGQYDGIARELYRLCKKDKKEKER